MSISISREERLRHITLPTSFSEAFELAIKLSEEEQKERTSLLPKKQAQTQIIHLNDPSSSSSSKPITRAVIDEDSKHDQSPYPSSKPKHQHRSRHFSTETHQHQHQPKPKTKETIMNPDDKMMLKLQFDLAGVMKKNQGKVNLEGTKMYQGKTTEYYLNTIIVETKPNQNGKEIIKNFPLDKPRNIKECLNKSNVQTFKNNASRLTTRLPEYSFTPIPRIKKDVALSKQEVNEIKSGQRIAVGLRRMEYAKQLREQQGLGCKKDKVVSRGTDRFIKKMKKKRKRRWVKRFKRRSSMKIKKKRSSNKFACSSHRNSNNNSRKEKIVFVDSVSGNDSEDVSIESCNSKHHSKRSISVDSAKNNNNNNNSIEEETNKTKVSLRSLRNKNRNNSARTPYKIYENKLNSKTVYHPGCKWKYPEKAKAKLSQLDALLKAKHIKLSFPRFICNIPKRKPLVVEPFNFNKVKLHYNNNNNDCTVPKKKQLSTDKQRNNTPLMKYDKNILDKLPLFDKWLKKKQLQQCFPKLIMGLLSKDNNEYYKEDKVRPISVIPKQTIRSNKHLIINDDKDKDKDKVSEGFPSVFSDFFEQQINEEDMPQVLDTVKTKFQRDSKELLPFKDEIPLNLQKELQLKTLKKGKEKLLHKDDNDNDDISSISNNGDDDDAGQFGIIQLTPMDKEDDKKASRNDKGELHDTIISLKQPVEHESECYNNNNSNNSESEDSSSDAMKNEVEVKQVDKSPTRNVSLNENKKGDTTMVKKDNDNKEMFTNEDDVNVMKGNYDAIGNDVVNANVNVNAPHEQSGSDDKGEDKSDLHDSGNEDEQYRDASPIGGELKDVKKSVDLHVHKEDSREMVHEEDKKELPTCVKQGDNNDKQVLSDDNDKSSLSDKNIGGDNEDKDMKNVDEQTEKENQKDKGSLLEVSNELNKEQEKLTGFVDEQKEIPKDVEDKDSLPVIDNKDKDIQLIDDSNKPKETEQTQIVVDNTKDNKEDIHPIDEERINSDKEQLPLIEELSTVKEEGTIKVKEEPKDIPSIEDNKVSPTKDIQLKESIPSKQEEIKEPTLIKEEDNLSPKKLETLNNLEKPAIVNKVEAKNEQEKDNKETQPIEDTSIVDKEKETSPIKEEEIIKVPSKQLKESNDTPLIEEQTSPHHEDTQSSPVDQIKPDNVTQPKSTIDDMDRSKDQKADIIPSTIEDNTNTQTKTNIEELPTIKEKESIQDKELDNKVIPKENIILKNSNEEQPLNERENKLISEEPMKTDIIPSELEKESEKETSLFPIDNTQDIHNKDESSPTKGGIEDKVLLDKPTTKLSTIPYEKETSQPIQEIISKDNNIDTFPEKKEEITVVPSKDMSILNDDLISPTNNETDVPELNKEEPTQEEQLIPHLQAEDKLNLNKENKDTTTHPISTEIPLETQIENEDNKQQFNNIVPEDKHDVSKEDTTKASPLETKDNVNIHPQEEDAEEIISINEGEESISQIPKETNDVNVNKEVDKKSVPLNKPEVVDERSLIEEKKPIIEISNDDKIIPPIRQKIEKRGLKIATVEEIQNKMQ